MKDKLRPYIPLVFLDYLRRYRDISYTIRFRMQYLGESRISSFLSAAKAFLLPTKIIVYYPVRPSYAYAEFKMCALLGITISDRLVSNAQVVHRREFSTKCETPDELRNINAGIKINFSNIDISKQHVESVFEAVFGYPLAIDPLSHTGQFVRKSDENFTHDGLVMDGPLREDQIEDGYVYEKLVDNSVNADEVMDIRIPVIGQEIAMLQTKIRPKNDRFSNNNTIVKTVPPDTVLSESEIEKMLEFARAMALEFLELDVLRDKNDHRLYIVDCNSTPAFGPPPGMSLPEQAKYMTAVANSYRDLVENK